MRTIRRMIRRRKTATNSLLCALAALLPAAVAAQQSEVPRAISLDDEQEPLRRYGVELIIFEYADGAGSTSELFVPDEPEPDPLEDAGAFADPVDEDGRPIPIDAEALIAGDVYDTADETLEEIVTYERIELEVLPPERYELDASYGRLVTLNAYRPLMRAAWVQPTLEREQTRPIELRRLGNPPLHLDGTVTLYLSRFLHLVIDVALEEKVPYRVPARQPRFQRYGDDDPGFAFGRIPQSRPVYYRIQEDRIVRNGELRYYDHPKFGVLAKITRIEETPPGGPNDDTSVLLPGRD